MISGVREALYEFQREFATRPGGAVLDGRDIGTVIAPDADVKLFIQADPAAAHGAPGPPVRAPRASRSTATPSRHRSRSGTRATAPTPTAASIPPATRTCSTPPSWSIEAALRAAVAIVDGVMARKARAQASNPTLRAARPLRHRPADRLPDSTQIASSSARAPGRPLLAVEPGAMLNPTTGALERRIWLSYRLHRKKISKPS